VNAYLNCILPVDSGNRAIITGRPELRLLAVPAQLAQIGVLQNLSPAQRQAFVVNAVRDKAENGHVSDAQAEDLTRHLLTELGASEGLSQLLDQPQLLAIWVELRIDSRHEVNKDFSRLNLIKEYLDRRLEHCIKQIRPTPQDSYREKARHERLLGALARLILASPNRVAPSPNRLVRSLAANIAQQEKRKINEQTTADIERWLTAITKHSGLLIKDAGGRLSFSHATFFTFYAARALSDMDEDARWSLIHQHLGEVHWRETVSTCAGLLGQFEPDERAATRLIAKILDEIFARSVLAPAELFLALAAALEGEVANQPQLVRLVQGCRELAQSTIPIVKNQALAGLCQLARAGQSEATSTVVAWLSEPTPPVQVIRATAALAVLAPSGPIALRLRALCAHQSPPIKAAAILASKGAAARDCEFRRALYSELNSPEDEVAQAAYQVLIPLFSTDGETQTQIRDRLTADNSRAVNNAFISLSEEALDVPGLREILYQRLDDQPAAVRQMLLIQLLSRGLSDLADRARLIAALDDPSEQVRNIVLGSLFYLSRFDAGIRDVVLSRIEGAWPPDPDDVPVQVVGLYVLFVRFMNMGDPKVWQVVRTKFTHSEPLVREWMATALEPWVSQIPELESILWRMVADDQEVADVRRAALNGLLPIVPLRPEWRELLLRRWSGAAATPQLYMPTMIYALGYMGGYDPAAQQLLEQLLTESKNSDERYLLLSALLQGRPQDQKLREQLLIALQDKNPWIVLSVFNTISFGLRVSDLDRTEVRALFFHSHTLVRRSAVQWLAQLMPREDRVEKLLLDLLRDKDSAVFEICFYSLLPQVENNPETFAQWANALRQRKANSPIVPQLGMVVLSIMLVVHADPAAALARLQALDGEFAEQVAAAVPHAKALVVDPLNTAKRYGEMFWKQTGSPIFQFFLAILQGQIAKKQGVLLSEEITTNLVSQSPGQQMSGLGMLLGQEQFSSEPSLLVNVGDSAVAPILRITGIMVAALAGPLPGTELTKLRAYLLEPELLPRVVALYAFLNTPLIVDNSELAASLIPWLGLVTEGAYDLRGEVCGPQAIFWNGTLTRQRLAALIAWHLPQQPEMYSQVVAMLDSPSWQARQAAAWALVYMPGGAPEDARSRLREVVKDILIDVDLLERLAVARSLLTMGSLPDEIEPEIWTLAKQAIRYGLQPWEFIPQQGKAVRESAVRLIAALPRGPAQSFLLDEVQTNDPNPEVRSLAFELLSAASVHEAAKVRTPLDLPDAPGAA